MAGIHFAFHMPCDIVNAFEVRDGRAAEFHDNASHSLDQYHPFFPPAVFQVRTRTNPVGSFFDKEPQVAGLLAKRRGARNAVYEPCGTPFFIAPAKEDVGME
jgi:hypothetical protein